jgi:hypothetical protein
MSFNHIPYINYNYKPYLFTFSFSIIKIHVSYKKQMYFSLKLQILKNITISPTITVTTMIFCIIFWKQRCDTANVSSLPSPNHQDKFLG